MSERIEAGDAIRFYCDKCETEFEITHEPKVNETNNKPIMPAKYVTHCPFCGDTELGAV